MIPKITPVTNPIPIEAKHIPKEALVDISVWVYFKRSVVPLLTLAAQIVVKIAETIACSPKTPGEQVQNIPKQRQSFFYMKI